MKKLILRKFFSAFSVLLILILMVSSCSSSKQTTTSQTKAILPEQLTLPKPDILISSSASAVKTLESQVLVDGMVFPENPRWHDGKLWFTDMHAHDVMTVDIDGKTTTIIETPNQPAGLGWDSNGHLLIVSATDKRLLRLDSGSISEVADLTNLASGTCNDMVVDGLGRAYIGNYGLNTDVKQGIIGAAEIVLVSPDGQTRVVADHMAFPNGSVITPDGRTLIVAESLAPRLVAFNIETDGSLSGRRLWAILPGDVHPDGICLDSEGGIWVGNASGNQVIRVLEGGKVTHRVNSSARAFACALGGPDLRTLFILAAETDDPDEARAKASGRIETVTVDIPGAGTPEVPTSQAVQGIKAEGIFGTDDTRHDSVSVGNNIVTMKYLTSKFYLHGDIEGTLSGPLIGESYIDGSSIWWGEGTFTGTINGKEGTFNFSLTGWGNFFTAAMDSGVFSYTITVLSGTKGLASLQGTISADTKFNISKIKGPYNALLSFKK